MLVPFLPLDILETKSSYKIYHHIHIKDFVKEHTFLYINKTKSPTLVENLMLHVWSSCFFCELQIKKNIKLTVYWTFLSRVVPIDPVVLEKIVTWKAYRQQTTTDAEWWKYLTWSFWVRWTKKGSNCLIHLQMILIYNVYSFRSFTSCNFVL